MNGQRLKPFSELPTEEREVDVQCSMNQSTEIKVVEISLDASIIQPGTIVPLYKTIFCMFIFFYFLGS